MCCTWVWEEHIEFTCLWLELATVDATCATEFSRAALAMQVALVSSLFLLFRRAPKSKPLWGWVQCSLWEWEFSTTAASEPQTQQGHFECTECVVKVERVRARSRHSKTLWYSKLTLEFLLCTRVKWRQLVHFSKFTPPFTTFLSYRTDTFISSSFVSFGAHLNWHF